MSGQHPDLSGDTLRSRTTDEQEEAATRAVLLRFEDGRLDATQVLTVLQALGLHPSGHGGQYGSDGKRESRTARVKTTTAVGVRVIRWEAYDVCSTCSRESGEPCRRLGASSGDISYPHPGRKQTTTWP
jgi:hypothetical protein